MARLDRYRIGMLTINAALMPHNAPVEVLVCKWGP